MCMRAYNSIHPAENLIVDNFALREEDTGKKKKERKNLLASQCRAFEQKLQDSQT